MTSDVPAASELGVVVPLRRMFELTEQLTKLPKLEQQVDTLQAQIIALRKLYHELLDHVAELQKEL